MGRGGTKFLLPYLEYKILYGFLELIIDVSRITTLTLTLYSGDTCNPRRGWKVALQLGFTVFWFYRGGYAPL